MILSDPSFERSHRREYYALSFENGMYRGHANNCDYRPNFIVFSNTLVVKFFSKRSWLAYNNIKHTKI